MSPIFPISFHCYWVQFQQHTVSAWIIVTFEATFICFGNMPIVCGLELHWMYNGIPWGAARSESLFEPRRQDCFDLKEFSVKMHEIDVELWWQLAASKESDRLIGRQFMQKVYSILMNGFSIFARSFAANLQLHRWKIIGGTTYGCTHTQHTTHHTSHEIYCTTRFDCVDHNSSSSITVYEHHIRLE